MFDYHRHDEIEWRGQLPAGSVRVEVEQRMSGTWQRYPERRARGQ